MPSETDKNTVSNNNNAAVPPVDPTGGNNVSNDNNANKKPATGWVQFEEDAGNEPSSTAAVITTESVQVNLDRSVNQPKSPMKKLSADIVVDTDTQLRTIELGNNEVVRQGFGEQTYIFKCREKQLSSWCY